MYLLNTTFHVHKSIDSEFCAWIREVYMAGAVSSTCIISAEFLRLMLEVQEDSSSYAIGLRTDNISEAVKWYETEGAAIRDEFTKVHGEKAVYFTTCMEVLDEA